MVQMVVIRMKFEFKVEVARVRVPKDGQGSHEGFLGDHALLHRIAKKLHRRKQRLKKIAEKIDPRDLEEKATRTSP